MDASKYILKKIRKKSMQLLMVWRGFFKKMVVTVLGNKITPKPNGVLVIKFLHILNNVFPAKTSWKLITNPFIPWASIWRDNYELLKKTKELVRLE